MDQKSTDTQYFYGPEIGRNDRNGDHTIEAHTIMDREKLLKARAQQALQSAMKDYRGGKQYESPKNKVYSDKYRELTRFQIDQGVIALVLQLNLSGGSIGDMDLYKLVRTYLWDEDARARINKIVDEKRLN